MIPICSPKHWRWCEEPRKGGQNHYTVLENPPENIQQALDDAGEDDCVFIASFASDADAIVVRADTVVKAEDGQWWQPYLPELSCGNVPTFTVHRITYGDYIQHGKLVFIFASRRGLNVTFTTDQVKHDTTYVDILQAACNGGDPMYLNYLSLMDLDEVKNIFNGTTKQYDASANGGKGGTRLIHSATNFCASLAESIVNVQLRPIVHEVHENETTTTMVAPAAATKVTEAAVADDDKYDEPFDLNSDSDSSAGSCGINSFRGDGLGCGKNKKDEGGGHTIAIGVTTTTTTTTMTKSEDSPSRPPLKSTCRWRRLKVSTATANTTTITTTTTNDSITARQPPSIVTMTGATAPVIGNIACSMMMMPPPPVIPVAPTGYVFSQPMQLHTTPDPRLRGDGFGVPVRLSRPTIGPTNGFGQLVQPVQPVTSAMSPLFAESLTRHLAGAVVGRRATNFRLLLLQSRHSFNGVHLYKLVQQPGDQTGTDAEFSDMLVNVYEHLSVQEQVNRWRMERNTKDYETVTALFYEISSRDVRNLNNLQRNMERGLRLVLDTFSLPPKLKTQLCDARSLYKRTRRT